MTPRISEMARYMKERHNVYLKRLNGWPGPWTDDPIIRDGRFCNVFRELDTVTIWIRKNIREPFANHPNLWIMLAIARYINWPPTLNLLLIKDPNTGERMYPGAFPDDPNFSPQGLTAALEDIASTGAKVYTGAYMIRAESDPNKEWYSWSKHRYIAEIVIGRLWEDREIFGEVFNYSNQNGIVQNGVERCYFLTLRDVWERFQEPRYVGWGPFMAYEVVTDMRHTRYLNHALDIYLWANAGPGAIRGLNRLYGRPLDKQPPKDQTNEEMRLLMNEFNDSSSIWPSKWPRLEMRDIEHSLCEFDKYERVRLNEGKMRSKYDWKKATQLRTGE